MRVEVIGDCTLYLGDCWELLDYVEKPDALLTDPPYGIADVWKGGGGKGWGKARRDSIVRNEWDKKTPSVGCFAKLIGISEYYIIWGGKSL